MSGSIGPGLLGLYALAARLLGWRPGEFWAATPAELVAALATPGAPASLDRDTLNKLMELDDGQIGQ